MTESDKQEILDAVTATIKLVVNGKIDKLTVAVDGIHERLDAQDIAMAPAIETIETIQSGRKFILWSVAPIAAIGSLIAMIKMYL